MLKKLKNTIVDLFKLHWLKLVILIALYLIIATTYKTCNQPKIITIDNRHGIDSLYLEIEELNFLITNQKERIEIITNNLKLKNDQINYIVKNNLNIINKYYERINELENERVCVDSTYINIKTLLNK